MTSRFICLFDFFASTFSEKIQISMQILKNSRFYFNSMQKDVQSMWRHKHQCVWSRSKETEIKVHQRLQRQVLPRHLTTQTWKWGKKVTKLRGFYASRVLMCLRSIVALDSPRSSLPELQRYKDAVRCTALGAEVPGHCQQQLTQTLIVRLLKTHFFTPIIDFEVNRI